MSSSRSVGRIWPEMVKNNFEKRRTALDDLTRDVYTCWERPTGFLVHGRALVASGKGRKSSADAEVVHAWQLEWLAGE